MAQAGTQWDMTRLAPRRGFDRAEFELRTGRAQKVMRKHNLDAIVLTLPPNIRYFTGFDSQFWESPTRPWFVVVPADGLPIAVIPEIGGPEMARTWLDDIRTWPAPRPVNDGTTLLAGVLQIFRAGQRGSASSSGANMPCACRSSSFWS